MQGKRLNIDKTESWRFLQLFVTGLHSNTNFTSDLYAKLSVMKSREGTIKPIRINSHELC